MTGFGYREFEAELVPFYARVSADKVYRDFPYKTVTRPVIRAVRTEHSTLTWYERPEGRCLLRHRVEVVADHWVGLTLGRRLECRCGKVSQIEVYG